MKHVTTLILACIALSGIAAAASIDKVKIQPEDTAWQGEGVTLNAACTPETAPLYISEIQIDAGSHQYVYNLNQETLGFSNGTLAPDTLRPFLLYPGNYTFTVACGTGTARDTTTRSLTIHRLTFHIPQDRLAELYAGNRSWATMNVSALEPGARNPNDIAAYVKGVRRSLYIDFNLSSQQFSPVDTVTVSGQVASPTEPVVATVNLQLSRSSLTLAQSTGTDGRFSFSFPAPNTPGGYTATITAAKPDYLQARSSFGFRVTREPVLRPVLPTTADLTDTSNTTVSGFMRNVGNEPAQITNITANHPYIKEIRIANQTIRPNQIVNLSIQVSVPPSPDRRNASIPITFHYREGNTTHRLLVRTGTTTAAAPTGMVAAVPDISTGILKYLFAALALLAGTVTLLRYSSPVQDLTPDTGPGASDEDTVRGAVSRIKTELED